ncbi:hypothetical protein [Blastococcus haudaquaticus]|uniref:DUF2530 domain-containing protein n=1 Tax=Blastococcus haudaquaticus TaxID=1938745 RepID=A0A286GV08_9ACTN|nr:hypothetical protein [Blastococcus haudaquaticus]SOD98844.1 hypothetical protein SAMN06272739_2052 [Blastococcus haudaquaticus]
MPRTWLRRPTRRASRTLWLAFWLAVAGIWLVALVVRIATGHDGWDIAVAAAWVGIAGVWIVRILRTPPAREHEDVEHRSA